MFEKKCSKQNYEYVAGKPEQLFVTVTETYSWVLYLFLFQKYFSMLYIGYDSL